jgi:thymidylate synthase
MTIGKRFEDIRAELHHDKLKNDFLIAMGFSPTEIDNKERRKIMAEAISGDNVQWERLERGCEIWDKLATEIQEFLSTLRENYGYILTEQYIHDRKKAYKAIDEINKIVGKIRRRNIEETDIDHFWISADTIRILLQDMARTKRFHEFVLDVDAKLITEQK